MSQSTPNVFSLRGLPVENFFPFSKITFDRRDVFDFSSALFHGSKVMIHYKFSLLLGIKQSYTFPQSYLTTIKTSIIFTTAVWSTTVVIMSS